jgi:hypothetical protein
VVRSAAGSYMLGVMHERPSYMLTGISKRNITIGTHASNAVEALRVADEWRKRGVADIKIEDEKGRTFDPHEFEQHARARAQSAPGTKPHSN